MTQQKPTPRPATLDLTTAISELTALLRDFRQAVGELPSQRDARTAAFVAERVKRILNADTPVPVVEGPRLVMHFLPSYCFGARPHVIDVAEAPSLRLFESAGAEAFNHEGRLTSSFRNSPKQSGYASLMPSGIEAVHAFRSPEDQQTGPIYVQWIEQKIVAAVSEYLGYWQKLQAPGPIEVFSALLSFEGLSLTAGNLMDSRLYSLPITSRCISLPRVKFEAPVRPDDVTSSFRLPLDVVWRTGGWKRCPSFDEHGAYKPR